MTELLPCPFCGGEGRWNWNKDYILCSSCDIAVRPSIWNTRPAPSPRMADVRLWTWTDESNRNPNVYAVRYCGTEMFTTNSANAAKSRCDELNLAATVTLPDAKKCEADRGIDWYAAYERMAHNRNELWAKLKAGEAALASKESDRG